VRDGLGVDEAIHGLPERDARRHQDREHDGVACPPLGASGAEEEGRSDRDSGEGVPEVVDEIGQKGNAPGEGVDARLSQGCRTEDRQADEHGAKPLAGADDRGIDPSVRVAAGMRIVVRVLGSMSEEAVADPGGVRVVTHRRARYRRRREPRWSGWLVQEKACKFSNTTGPRHLLPEVRPKRNEASEGQPAAGGQVGAQGLSRPRVPLRQRMRAVWDNY